MTQPTDVLISRRARPTSWRGPVAVLCLGAAMLAPLSHNAQAATPVGTPAATATATPTATASATPAAYASAMAQFQRAADGDDSAIEAAASEWRALSSADRLSCDSGPFLSSCGAIFACFFRMAAI